MVSKLGVWNTNAMWNYTVHISRGFYQLKVHCAMVVHCVWSGVINYPLVWGSPFVCAGQRAANLPVSISWQSLPQQTKQERTLILVERVDVAVCALMDVSVDCTDNKVGDLCVSSKKRNNHKASWVQFSEPRLILKALSASFTASSPSVWLIWSLLLMITHWGFSHHITRLTVMLPKRGFDFFFSKKMT